MKRYIITAGSFLILLMLDQGCKKTLEESPQTFISPGAFFNSPANYEAAVKGIYSSLPGLYGGNTMMMREMFSDIYGTPSASFEQALPTYQNNHQPFFYNVRDEWSNDYSIVKNANFILSKLAGSPLPDAQKNAFIAEARFLRAFAYFQLVQFFGDVPLRTQPVESYSEVQLPRSSQDSVYHLILDDLQFAEANLPESVPQQGRVYKWVATALLAKIYLTMAGEPLKQTQYYKDAEEKALAVINSGKFQLMDDYAAVFHNTAYTKESIWEVLFDPGRGGNGLQGLSCTEVGYVPILLPAGWFINSFPPGDQRKAWGIRSDYVDPNGVTLAPYFQKFVNNALIDQGIAPSAVSGLLAYSIPVLRLGEMYLIAAEAENEMNGPANAYQYINRIRQRARIDKNNPAEVPDLSGLTKDQFRAAVLMERKWELHLEGSSWFDMKRSGTLNKIQTLRGTQLVHPIGPYNNTWYIPDNEITNNNIPQNPAYQ